MTHFIKRRINCFRRAEDGTVAFDFVLWFPFFLFLMLMGIEVGLVGLKHMKLERSMDETVRWVRLNTGASPTHADLKQMICSTNPVRDCMNNLHLEMVNMDLRQWTGLSDTYACVDHAEPIDPMDQLSLGEDNELMVLRVCAEFLPFMPGSGLFQMMMGGNSILTMDDEGYASMRKSTAFVQEPR